MAILLFYPRTYRSEAKLFVRVGRESVTLDPTATMGPTLALQRSQDNEINSVLEILNSRRIANQVVRDIGEDKILARHGIWNPITEISNRATDAIGTALDSFAKVPETADVGDATHDPVIEKATSILEKCTRITAPKNSNVVTIRAKAGSPSLAQQIAQTTVDVFLQEHVRLNRTEGSFDFFKSQSELLLNQLGKAQDDLRDRKNEYSIATVDDKRGILERRLSDIELEQIRTVREAAFTNASIAGLNDHVSKLSTEIVTASISGYANVARDSMREKLYELEIREQELRQKHTPSHPFVTAIAKQRTELSRIISSQPVQRKQTTSELNPIRQTLDLKLKSELAKSAALAARQEVLTSQLADAQRDLRTLNDQSVEIAGLQRAVDLLEANYRTHFEKFEQARIDAALEVQRISNINIVQRASYVSKPASPKKRLVLLGSFTFGILGAFGIAALAENMDRSIVTSDEAESHLGLPVLLTVENNRTVVGFARQMRCAR